MRVFSHYSIGYGFGQVDDLLAKADTLDLPYIGLTDIHGVVGVPELLSGLEKVNEGRIKKGKVPIKSYVGTTLYVKKGDLYEYTTLICKTKESYKQLLKTLVLVEEEKGIEYFQFDKIKDFLPHFIVLTDGPISCYADKDDAILHRLCICANYNYTFEETDKLFEKHPLVKLFWDNTFELHNVEWPKEFEQIEQFSIKAKPVLPRFDDKIDSNELLRNYCREGWTKRNINALCKDKLELKEIYAKRIQEELKVIGEAKLADYFLIIHDLIAFCRKNKSKVGLRGSAAGCLTSYLSGITEIDPVWPDKSLPYHEARSLSFARFYNHYRNTEDHISLPDCDVDLCPSFRDKVKEYLQNKYTSGHFASYILTHGRYDGKGALKTVFRVLNTVSPEEANDITKFMVPYEKIQDDIEDKKEENPKYNTLLWNIENMPEIHENYKEYTKEFDMAVKLSGVCYARSKHAAGVVISARNLEEDFPVILSSDGAKILGLEMEWAEYVGAVKYDLLCVAAYEKLNQIARMIETGANEPVVGEIEEDME